MAHEGLTTGKAAEYIGRHPKTLQAMDRDGGKPKAAELKRLFNATKYETPFCCYG